MNLTPFINAGISIIPVGTDKRPLLAWEPYQTRLAEAAEVLAWAPPIAAVAGKVSGGLVCMDFDNKKRAETMEHYLEWHELVFNHKPELLNNLVIQKTPSGGLHVIFRTPLEVRNTKLANDTDNSVLIETRGEGGYFLCDPSPNYKVISGKFSEIPVIAPEDVEFLFSCARSLNRRVKNECIPPLNGNSVYTVTPFDDYDSKNTPLEILTAHNWQIVRQYGDTTYLKRPGKEERGISATWNHIPGRFYCFTTSTEFENEHIYKASAVYTILEHGGDFKRAAGALLELGYGKKDETQTEVKQPVKLHVVSVKDFEKRIWEVKRNGYPKGINCGWDNLDKFYRIAKGQVTIISGVPTHGKSEFMDAIMVNVAKAVNWKWFLFSPENYPFEMHFQKLAEKYIGKRFLQMSDVEVNSVINFIQTHFCFIDPCEEMVSMNSILELTESNKPDALVIDPWNEIESARPADVSETDYIGKTLTTVRKFARKNNIAVFIVAHPAKLRREKNGDYPRPTMYDISGSAHWYNKSDNGLIVWRDFKGGYTEIIVEKVKFKHYGHRTNPGDVKLKYHLESGRYEEMTENDAVGFGVD